MPRDEDEVRALVTGRKQTAWAKQDERDIDDAVKSMLQHALGRKLLWWLLQIGRVGAQPFVQDPLITAFNCGELNIGQQVLARLISVDPQGYVTMQTEHANEHVQRTAELAALLADRNASTGGDDQSGGNYSSDPAD